jgi:hypothetical protein
VSFLSTILTLPKAPLPTTRRRRKWFKFAASARSCQQVTSRGKGNEGALDSMGTPSPSNSTGFPWLFPMAADVVWLVGRGGLFLRHGNQSRPQMKKHSVLQLFSVLGTFWALTVGLETWNPKINRTWALAEETGAAEAQSALFVDGASPHRWWRQSCKCKYKAWDPQSCCFRVRLLGSFRCWQATSTAGEVRPRAIEGYRGSEMRRVGSNTTPR